MSLGFPDIAQFEFKVGHPPGPQPTASSASLFWIELNSLATGGCRGTRADQGRCELIKAVRAANGSRKKLRVCRPYKQSVGPRDTLHIPGICAPFSESRLVHIFPGGLPHSFSRKTE